MSFFYLMIVVTGSKDRGTDTKGQNWSSNKFDQSGIKN